MEKFYIVTDESPIRQMYLDYLENNKKVCALYDAFSHKHGIETSQFYPTETLLGIVPTRHDAERFAQQLCKKSDGETGLRLFKIRSATNKAWVSALAACEIKPMRKPRLSWELCIFRRCGTRLFSHDGTVYASIDVDGDLENPKGFQQIPGSQFYSVIEAIEAAE